MITELIIALSVYTRKSNYTGIMCASIGILINIVCLALLLVAEAKRCCPRYESDAVLRLLAAADPYTSAYKDDHQTGYSENEDTDCCGQVS